MKCGIGLNDGQGHDVAEFVDMQGKGVIESTTLAHLEEVGDFVVNGLDEVLRRIMVGDAFAQFGSILRCKEQDAIRLLTVPAGSACFLEIGLDAGGQVVVNDEADIGFVDTHTEGVGADHDACGARFPSRLTPSAFGGVQAGVVEVGGEALGCQPVGELFATFAIPDIDDTGTGHAVEDTEDLAEFVVGVGATTDDVAEVFTVETLSIYVPGVMGYG